MGWRPHDGYYGPVPTTPIPEWKCVLGRVLRRGFSPAVVDDVTGAHIDGSPAERLRDGVDVYVAAWRLCNRHDCPLSDKDLPRIAAHSRKLMPRPLTSFDAGRSSWNSVEKQRSSALMQAADQAWSVPRSHSGVRGQA